MTFAKLAFVAAPLMALTMVAAAPAEAQSRYYDRDRRDNNNGDVVAGVVIGAIAGGLIASAGSNDRNDCFYRDGRCWRNQGHWEREHGINSRDYRYDRRDYRRDRWDRRDGRRDDRRDYRRDYRYDRRW